MTYQEAIQEQIDTIMDIFEFDRVSALMVHDNWTWGESVPDVTEIRQAARKLMRDAVKIKGLISSGGFTAGFTHNAEERYVRLYLYFGYSIINDGTEYTP